MYYTQYVYASHICTPTAGHRSVRGPIIRGRVHDRSLSPPRVHVPIIESTSDTSQSVRGSVYVSVDDHATSSGPSLPISGTPLSFLNPL